MRWRHAVAASGAATDVPAGGAATQVEGVLEVEFDAGVCIAVCCSSDLEVTALLPTGALYVVLARFKLHGRAIAVGQVQLFDAGGHCSCLEVQHFVDLQIDPGVFAGRQVEDACLGVEGQGLAGAASTRTGTCDTELTIAADGAGRVAVVEEYLVSASTLTNNCRTTYTDIFEDSFSQIYADIISLSITDLDPLLLRNPF